MACGNSKEELRKLENPADAGMEKAKDVTILYSDSAVVRVRIKAPVMRSKSINIPNPYREFPNGITVEFFGENRQPTSFLSAKRAIRYDNTNRVELQDSVVIWNYQKEKMEAEVLVWDEHTDRITSERFVRISKADEIIEGYGLDSDLEFQHWTLKRVSGIIRRQSMTN